MGKNHAHKKKLKSEKAKTQLNSKAKTQLTSKTKFLPKGQNITNTTFKIRPIIIPQQLKEKDASQILSKRKQTIPELLTKLKHFNDKIKSDACDDLTEIIQTHAIDTFLGAIIQTASMLVQDRERKVRRGCLKLLTAILEAVPAGQLAPFFVYLSTNLRCAMTNIDKNVQEDSLLLLDAVIERTPRLVADNFTKIFLDFLTLISKLRSGSGSQRTLTLNLGSKMANVKWRLKVLDTLYGLLDVTNQAEKAKEKQLKAPELGAHCTVFAPIYARIAFLEEVNTKTRENDDFLKNYLGNLMPLLHESWLEVVPEKDGEKGASKEEVALVVRSTIRILDLLHQHVTRLQLEEEVFGGMESEKFLNRLKAYFSIKPANNKKVGLAKEFAEFLVKVLASF